MNYGDEDSPFWLSTVRTGIDLVIRPSAAFRTVSAEPLLTAVIRYGMVVLTSLILFLTGYWLMHEKHLERYPELARQPFYAWCAGDFYWYVIVFTAGFLILFLIFHAAVLAAGGRAGVQKSFIVLLYAVWPFVLAFGVFKFLAMQGITFRPEYFFHIFTLWTAALGAIGTREAHDISTARAVLSAVLVLLALAGILILLFVLFPPRM